MKAWSPTDTAAPASVTAAARRTACSETMAPSPTSIREPSASITAPYMTRTSRPIRTSPTNVAFGATHAVGSTTGSAFLCRISMSPMLAPRGEVGWRESDIAFLPDTPYALTSLTRLVLGGIDLGQQRRLPLLRTERGVHT